MNLNRRSLALLTAAAALTGAGLLPGAAMAQPDAHWPSKPIKWVVPFPPGGAMDVIARTLGDKAARELGQAFVVENRIHVVPPCTISAEQIAKGLAIFDSVFARFATLAK